MSPLKIPPPVADNYPGGDSGRLYCPCPEFIPPWRCCHFVGGSWIRFKAPLVKGGASEGGGGIGGRPKLAPTGMVKVLRRAEVVAPYARIIPVQCNYNNAPYESIIPVPCKRPALR